jgi:hypothetical protein
MALPHRLKDVLMRTTTSLLASIALTACGTSAEFEPGLDTQGIIQAGADINDIVILNPPETSVDVGVGITVIDGLPRLDNPGFPGTGAEREEGEEGERGEEGDEQAEAPEEPGSAGLSRMDRAFDPDGYCEPEPAERDCPSPHDAPEGTLSEAQLRALGSLAESCEAWIKHGPASYAMDVYESHMMPNGDMFEAQIDATVCTGATVDAFDIDAEEPIDATKVASIDNLYWAAADHIINGHQIELTIDPNLSYIDRMGVMVDADGQQEMFEVTTRLRPIGPNIAD